MSLTVCITAEKTVVDYFHFHMLCLESKRKTRCLCIRTHKNVIKSTYASIFTNFWPHPTTNVVPKNPSLIMQCVTWCFSYLLDKKKSEREDKQNVLAKSIIIEIRKTPFDAHQKSTHSTFYSIHKHQVICIYVRVRSLTFSLTWFLSILSTNISYTKIYSTNFLHRIDSVILLLSSYMGNMDFRRISCLSVQRRVWAKRFCFWIMPFTYPDKVRHTHARKSLTSYTGKNPLQIRTLLFLNHFIHN